MLSKFEEIFEQAYALWMKAKYSDYGEQYLKDIQEGVMISYNRVKKLDTFEMMNLLVALRLFPPAIELQSGFLMVVRRLINNMKFGYHCADCAFPLFIEEKTGDVEICPVCGR